MNSTYPYGNNPGSGKTLALDDATIYYETYGTGRPVLLLHGNNQSITAFANQIGVLAGQHQVIAVDARGQGNSTDESTNPLTYEIFAADMVRLLDHLNLKNVDILGWSDGGITGLIMAARYPEYVNRLAVMGANLFPEGLKNIVFADTRESIEELSILNDGDSANKKRIYELVLNEPRLTFDELKQITAPVLVMAGENDIVLENHTRRIAENIPQAKLKIFSSASHFAPRYKADEFNNEVLAFLGS